MSFGTFYSSCRSSGIPAWYLILELSTPGISYTQYRVLQRREVHTSHHIVNNTLCTLTRWHRSCRSNGRQLARTIKNNNRVNKQLLQKLKVAATSWIFCSLFCWIWSPYYLHQTTGILCFLFSFLVVLFKQVTQNINFGFGLGFGYSAPTSTTATATGARDGRIANEHMSCQRETTTCGERANETLNLPVDVSPDDLNNHTRLRLVLILMFYELQK